MKVTIEFHFEEQLDPWSDTPPTLEDISLLIKRQLAGWDNSVQACIVVDKVYDFAREGITEK